MRPYVYIEAIFSVIDGLREYNIENIGELSICSSRKFLKQTLLEKQVPAKTILESLERRFQRFIRICCQLKSKYRQKMVNTYTNFFNIISNTTNAPQTSSNLKYDNRWTLFTTNYDRCLEAFWRENFRVSLDTGFRGKDGTLSSDHFLYTYGSQVSSLRNVSGNPRLVKLHGSITWLKREDTGEIEEQIFHLDQGFSELGTGSLYTDKIVIYPLRQKQLYVDPYILMFYLLNKELALGTVWIVVGYPFTYLVISFHIIFTYCYC
jgi:hypothetical protein